MVGTRTEVEQLRYKGVDVELNDAVQRLRFEHQGSGDYIMTGAYDKIFCAGANIRMLGMAPHAFKVNFCKYTNETRVRIEDATEHSGRVYIAATARHPVAVTNSRWLVKDLSF